MITSHESLNLLSQLNQIYKSININIDKLLSNPKNLNHSLLRETNRLICSGTLIIAQLYEKNENKKIIEKEYNKLEEYRNKLSNINSIYKLDALNQINKNINYMTPISDSKDGVVDISLTTDYQEKLLQGSMHNLYEVNNNLNQVAFNLKNQGDTLINTNEQIKLGNTINQKSGSILSEISFNEKVKKLSMFIINFILFSIIIIMITIKIIHLFKY